MLHILPILEEIYKNVFLTGNTFTVKFWDEFKMVSCLVRRCHLSNTTFSWLLLGPVAMLHRVVYRENVTRHLYYLQLKENILHYDHVCTEEKCFQIASFALQADFGNYYPEKYGDDYFDPREYFPAWVNSSLNSDKLIIFVSKRKLSVDKRTHTHIVVHTVYILPQMILNVICNDYFV